MSNWVGAELPPADLNPPQKLTNIQLILVYHYPCFSQQSCRNPVVSFAEGLSTHPCHGSQCGLSFKRAKYWARLQLDHCVCAISSTPNVPTSRSSTHQIWLSVCQGCSLQVSYTWKSGSRRAEAASWVAESCRAVTRTVSQACKMESGRCPWVYSVNINFSTEYPEKS